MRQLKTIIALILALCMIAAIAACTAGTPDKEDDKKEENTTTTTKKQEDLPDLPPEGDDDDDLPDPVAQNVDDDVSNRVVFTVVADSATVENLNQWGDQVASKLFDGDTVQTKLGGDIPKGDTFTLKFQTESPCTVEYYVLTTGGDTTVYPDRNPIAWVLSGSMDGETYTVIDNVEDTETLICGLEVEDSTPFTYKVDSPAQYLFYKIEFTVFGTQFQLNELQLIGAEIA